MGTSAALHVLRRLPLPASSNFAAFRCVRHSIAAARALLLPHRSRLFTSKVHGVFINYVDHRRPHLFARPSPTSPQIDAMLDFLPSDNHRCGWWSVLDHSNGLLLCDMRWGTELCVCNPATQRWALVPWPPVASGDFASMYLAFDPEVSPHYEVFVIPAVPEKLKEQDDDKGPRNNDIVMEWPPETWRLKIFSSRNNQWEERAFVREGEPAGTLEEMLLDTPTLEPLGWGPRQRYAVYWQGALYVHCQGHFVLRLSLSNHRYQVIKTPSFTKENSYVKPYIGKSEKGVYFGVVQESQLQVWILSESSGQMEWIIRSQDDLDHYAQYVANYWRKMNAPWMVHDVPNTDAAAKTLVKDQSEWDSDNDDFVTTKDEAVEYYHKFSLFLGFHPYKEVVFLTDIFTVVAYHLKSKKVQYLGNSRPESYYLNYTNGIYESFVYTPCMKGALDEGNTDKSSFQDELL